METLPVSCRITTAGGWLVLTEGPYRLSAEAFGEQAVTFRRTDVANPFVAGSWTVNAVRENVIETLAVWVRTDTTKDTQAAVFALTEALRQINFGLEFVVDGVRYFYQCNCADLSVKTPREFRFSTMAQVVAQVPRYPVYEWQVV